MSFTAWVRQMHVFGLIKNLLFCQKTVLLIDNNNFIRWRKFIVENSLPIPPNRKHNLLLMKVCFWAYLGGSWSFSFQILVDHQFIIPIYKWVQKMMFFFNRVQSTNFISRSDAPVGPYRWPWRVLHPSVESVNLINFSNMVKNTFVWDMKIISNISSSKIRTLVH